LEPAEEASEVEVDVQEQKLRRGRKSRQSDFSPVGAKKFNFNAETTKKQTFTNQHSPSGKNDIDALLFTNHSQARSERHETTEAGIDEIYYK
jgi:hypothetical protein